MARDFSCSLAYFFICGLGVSTLLPPGHLNNIFSTPNLTPKILIKVRQNHSHKIWGVIQKFCIADLFSVKNQQMGLKPKKLYSPGYNLLFDLITISSQAFFVSINEFVDASPIPCWAILFNGLLLQGLSLILVCPTLSLYTHQFTVDFDNILYTIHYQCCQMYRNFCTSTDFWYRFPKNTDCLEILLLFRY